MSDLSHVVTASGARLPALGFGTYGMDGAALARVLPQALQAGFRHVDTAQIYRNEDAVGDSVVRAGVPRSDLFLTTKVWVTNYDRHAMARSIEESLARLRTDYIDLLLLHWPNPAVPLVEQLAGLNAAVREGKVRHIGVSNFNGATVAAAAKVSDTPLVTNQVEYHPYLNQTALAAETRRQGLSVTAYCAMAVGQVFGDPVLREIAARLDRSVAQVVLRWLVQQPQTLALSRSTDPDRAVANLQIFGFELGVADMAAIGALARDGSRIVDPPGLAPIWDPTPAVRVETAG
jgi:diketogulonate reductase-like aldo/keto reductase